MIRNNSSIIEIKNKDIGLRQDSKLIFIETSLLFFSMLLAPTTAFLDIAVLNNRMVETSVTEFSQSFIILFTALLFYQAAKSADLLKGILVLACTLMIMIFIRESDHYLDSIYHGFWKVPVFIVFCTGFYIVFKGKLTVFTAIKQALNQKAFGYMLSGLFITLVFSRLFGTGSIWETVLPVEDAGYIKTVIQESLELLGYCLIFLGALLHRIETRTNENQVIK